MPTLPALRHQLNAAPRASQKFLHNLGGLLAPNTLDVALAYTFMKLEEGNHRALKCALIIKLKCDTRKVDDALAKQHFSRSYYKTVFKNVVGSRVPLEASKALEAAETVRDRQIHGKEVTDAPLRQGISDALNYIQILGIFIEDKIGRNPYGDLRGLVGRAEKLDGPRTYWVLKGMGFYTQD